MPELRKDPITGRWVIISTDRQKRPDDFHFERVTVAGREHCPFCPGHEDRTPPEVARATIGETEHTTLVIGHTHSQFDWELGDLRLVNAGSVGMPTCSMKTSCVAAVPPCIPSTTMTSAPAFTASCTS
jgi:predicted phosphodiesterase